MSITITFQKKVYEHKLTTSLKEVREVLLNDNELSLDEFDLSNISEKVKRNFGKMVLQLGQIYRIDDNKVLGDFFQGGETINVDLVKHVKVETVTNVPSVTNVKVNQFVYNSDDFPPL